MAEGMVDPVKNFFWFDHLAKIWLRYHADVGVVHYTCDTLLALRANHCRISDVLAARIRLLGLKDTPPARRPCFRHYRGVRAGRRRRVAPRSSPAAVPGLSIISTPRHWPGDVAMSTATHRPDRSALVRVRVDRHTHQSSKELTFGCLSIMRLESKLDDLLEVWRDQSIDVLLVTESWHDPDSVCVRRLRTDGYTVVERARPRVQSATLDMNHGGVLAFHAKM